MTYWHELVAHYLNLFRQGQDTYLDLLHDREVIPPLIEAFQIEGDPEVRAFIADVVWEHRQLETLEFLAQALDDIDSRVWKSALDGLVAFGMHIEEQSSLAALEAARLRCHEAGRALSKKAEWIDEAIEQIRDWHGPGAIE